MCLQLCLYVSLKELIRTTNQTFVEIIGINTLPTYEALLCLGV
jgi:hypothetical protein